MKLLLNTARYSVTDRSINHVYMLTVIPRREGVLVEKHTVAERANKFPK